MHAPLLATRHPQVAVEPDAIFVRDGRVWSSAGVTTGIDLALALIEEDAGRQVAMNVARMLGVYLKRSGGQSQYSALLAAQVQSESETFDPLDRWIAEHLNDDLRVGALAEQVRMSPKYFARAYAEKRGRTPAKAAEAIRVEAARRRLEETEDRIGSVAEGAGFNDEEQMRCSFIRVLGIPPREYRKRFATTVLFRQLWEMVPLAMTSSYSLLVGSTVPDEQSADYTLSSTHTYSASQPDASIPS